jgi:hypothetical protein
VTTKRPKLGFIRRLGHLTVAAGMLLAVAGMATAPAKADPKGNNGTVKLDGLDLNDGPGHTGKPNDPDETDPDNDPHVTCGFQLEFFNFDLGQKADITFTAHPPTGSNGILLSQSQVVISDDGTGGANNDPDAVFDYDVTTDFDVSQFTSVHPIHGWHIKLDLTLYSADGKKVPGGQKHKVFWAEGCAPDPECDPQTDVNGCEVPCDPQTDENGCEVPCDPQTDENGCEVPCDPQTDENGCEVPCDPQTDENGCEVPCDPQTDENGCEVPCDPQTDENGCEVPCDPQTDENGCEEPCVDDPETRGNECAPPPPPGCQVSCTPPPFDQCPLVAGNQPQGTDCTPPVVDECPDDVGLQPNGDQCSVAEVEPEVVVPPVVSPAKPTTVKGEVLTRTAPAQLPRTGTTTLPLLEVGFGLVLLGVGAMLFGRERTASI